MSYGHISSFILFLLQYVFSMFMHINETYRLMEQLANMAMKQLMLEGGFEEDKTILDRTK